MLIDPHPRHVVVATGPEAAGDASAGLAAFLLERGLIDPATLDRAQRAADKTGEPLHRAVTKLGLISEVDLTAALSIFLSIPIVTATQIPATAVLPDIARPDFVRINKIIPISSATDELVVAIVDPFHDEPLRALAYLMDQKVTPRLMAPADFDKAYQALYKPEGEDAPGAHSRDGAEGNEDDVQRLRDMASEAPTIRLVNQLIYDAVEGGASDIHIEPTPDTMVVRYRVDGALRTIKSAPLAMRAAITSRVKIMARLDIAERRLPQDGRTKVSVRGIDVDFRVSTVPTAFGESVVLRILDRSRVNLDFVELGFEPAQVAALQQLVQLPNGIILVTGPTGSGKTTTLYTALKALNSRDRKLFTVEDPIEYQMPGINQLQVHQAIGLDFPHALRAILRQDPDIIMVGEIRDLETARIAVQASLTGHLVFSTLHTNSAAAAITRLVDMGIETYLLASTLRAVLAQRLVRRLCPRCSRPDSRASAWVQHRREQATDMTAWGAPNMRQATGCSMCAHTGYSGRTTIAELMVVDVEMGRLVSSKAIEADLELAALRQGMRSLHDAGMAKVWTGETTLEEVLRATRTDTSR